MNRKNLTYQELFLIVPCFTLLFLAIVGLSGCKSQKKSTGADKIAKNAKVLVYIRKTPCYGKCPAYEASFYDNGQVIYFGKSNIPLLGRYLYTVPKETIANFQNQARRINYHKLQKSWMLNTDLPSTITEINFDGTTSKIEVQGNAPDDLRKLQELIHTTVITMTEEQPGKKLPEDDELLNNKK